MNRKFALMVGLLSILSTTGCLLNRSIARVEDHPQRNAMILETLDTRLTPMAFMTGFVSLRHQFWVCEEGQPGTLDCTQTCGKKSEAKLECPEYLYMSTGVAVVTHTGDYRTGVTAPAPAPVHEAVAPAPAPVHDAMPASTPAPAPTKKAKKKK